MWYIAEQENDQMSLMATSKKPRKRKKKKSNAYSLFPNNVRKTGKQIVTVAKGNSLPCTVGRRRSHRRMPVGFSSDAVIFTVDPKRIPMAM